MRQRQSRHARLMRERSWGEAEPKPLSTASPPLQSCSALPGMRSVSFYVSPSKAVQDRKAAVKLGATESPQTNESHSSPGSCSSDVMELVDRPEQDSWPETDGAAADDASDSSREPACRVKWCTRPGKRFGLCWAHGGVKKCCHNGCRKVAIPGEFCAVHERGITMGTS
ncbi:TPA: hypothetical protein N0F65_000462 [Lagenidium giganteum]|uniref:Uncharacterized protein n=1 Tax=Lagenidium giganteum TaxID=4803 RepID=A0AAV2Z3I3_9STRA|nr:TPA: hypothetical protein N0F65_000462 [Lagenidium giganteum]